MVHLKDRVDIVISALSGVTKGIYLLIAISLTLLAIISFYDVTLQMATLIHTRDMTQGILQVLHALLLTIIIVEILETVTAYFKTSRLQVTPILVAGITANGSADADLRDRRALRSRRYWYDTRRNPGSDRRDHLY